MRIAVAIAIDPWHQLRMDQDTFIRRIADSVREERLFDAFFLAGSFGNGTADAFSDVDFVAEAALLPDAALRWRSLVERVAPVVFWNQRGRDPILLNAITAQWLRCDLVIVPPGGIASRARNGVKPLFDPNAIYATLPECLPTAAPDPGRVLAIVNEFLRVLGLLQVVVGRGEYLNAVGGAGLLRDHLVELMLEEACPGDRGGALHLHRLLPPDDVATLYALPFPAPVADAVVAAHYRIARAFRPRAHALCLRLGVVWPEQFERATLGALDEHCASSSIGPWQELARHPP